MTFEEKMQQLIDINCKSNNSIFPALRSLMLMYEGNELTQFIFSKAIHKISDVDYKLKYTADFMSLDCIKMTITKEIEDGEELISIYCEDVYQATAVKRLLDSAFDKPNRIIIEGDLYKLITEKTYYKDKYLYERMLERE